MKQLNQYILEKLKINKESQKKSMFDEGDRCLRLYFFNENSHKYFFMDVCTILENLESKAVLSYLLDKTTRNQKYIERIGKCDYYYTQNENIVFREESTKRNGMIFIAKDEAKKFLDNLEKNNYKYNLSELITNWDTKEDRTSKAYYYDSDIKLSSETIKLIKDKLDENPE